MGIDSKTVTASYRHEAFVLGVETYNKKGCRKMTLI